MWTFIKELLWDNPHQRWFLWLLLGINAPGSVYGFWWYHEQIAATPVKYWLMVPDSPRSSMLFTLMLVMLLAGRRWPLFQLWACTAVIKYGFWAIIIISDYWLGGGKQTLTEWMLWLSHGGMALEGFLFLRHLDLRIWQVVTIGAWMLWNDYVDYVWGLHPYFFTSDQGTVAVISAVGLSLLLVVFTWNRVTR